MSPPLSSKKHSFGPSAMGIKCCDQTILLFQLSCATMELLLDTRLEAGNLPESWLAILLNVTEDDLI